MGTTHPSYPYPQVYPIHIQVRGVSLSLPHKINLIGKVKHFIGTFFGTFFGTYNFNRNLYRNLSFGTYNDPKFVYPTYRAM